MVRSYGTFLCFMLISVYPITLLLHAQTLITSVNVIDVSTGDIARDQDVLISGGFITRIDKNIREDSGENTIDGSGQWLIPGLIDAHIHMFQSGGLYTRPDALDLRDVRSYEQERKWLIDHATDIYDAYLSAGITSVLDVGGPMTNYDLRSQITKDRGLDYYCTGPLISTYLPEAFRIEDPPIIKAHTIEEGVSLVRSQLTYEPDVIKIWYINSPGIAPPNHRDIVRAVIRESHDHNIPVAVHATDLTTAKIAVLEGADILVHSVRDPVDDDFINMLLDNEVVLIPTLIVHETYDKAFLGSLDITAHDLDNGVPGPISDLLDVHHLVHDQLAEAQYYAPSFLASNLIRDSIRSDNLKKLVDAGVVIATGTDAGNIGTLHATSYISELKAMQSAGLTNLQILSAATYGAAHAIGKQSSHGKVEEGRAADLILLSSNPLDDLSALLEVSAVIKDGHKVDLSTLKKRTPEELVQMQLNAYNVGNIESFLLPYSDSVKVYDFPNQFRYQGIDRMRTSYASFFESTPDLHCELINRIVLGNTVIDQERVTGLGADRIIEAIAIYKIRNGKIQEVYFDDGR